MTDDARMPEGGDRERTALKEWAVLVDAMSRGELVAMVRKGGIREQRAGFSVRHDRFVLYPTWFHEKLAEVAPRLRPTLDAAHAHRPPEGTIRVEHVCDVAGVWWVSALDRLDAVRDAHGLADETVASRFHYRGRPGVHVVAVRVRRLGAPALVPELRRYQGCVSWVALDDGIDVAGAVPVLADAAFGARLAALRHALGEPLARD